MGLRGSTLSSLKVLIICYIFWYCRDTLFNRTAVYRLCRSVSAMVRQIRIIMMIPYNLLQCFITLQSEKPKFIKLVDVIRVDYHPLGFLPL